MKEIKVFSPASVSNICCGFDVLGFAIEGLGDIISLKKIDKREFLLKISQVLTFLWMLKKILQQ